MNLIEEMKQLIKKWILKSHSNHFKFVTDYEESANIRRDLLNNIELEENLKLHEIIINKLIPIYQFENFKQQVIKKNNETVDYFKDSKNAQDSYNKLSFGNLIDIPIDIDKYDMIDQLSVSFFKGVNSFVNLEFIIIPSKNFQNKYIESFKQPLKVKYKLMLFNDIRLIFKEKSLLRQVVIEKPSYTSNSSTLIIALKKQLDKYLNSIIKNNYFLSVNSYTNLCFDYENSFYKKHVSLIEDYFEIKPNHSFRTTNNNFSFIIGNDSFSMINFRERGIFYDNQFTFEKISILCFQLNTLISERPKLNDLKNNLYNYSDQQKKNNYQDLLVLQTEINRLKDLIERIYLDTNSNYFRRQIISTLEKYKNKKTQSLSYFLLSAVDSSFETFNMNINNMGLKIKNLSEQEKLKIEHKKNQYLLLIAFLGLFISLVQLYGFVGKTSLLKEICIYLYCLFS